MRDKILSKLRMPDGTINPWVIALTVTLATFMEVLDTSIANVSLPHIAGNLSVGEDQSTWVLTSYLVSNAIILPLSGWFSGLLGRKRFYMLCVALFTVSSFLCGLAPSLSVLVLFRILQGAGGGGLQPSEQAILNDTFPLEKRGMAFAVYGIAVVVAPTIGPWLGGWITDNFSWRWVFYINVPVGIVSLLLTSLLVSDPPYMKKANLRAGFRIDYIGIGLISLGLGSMQIILDKGQRDDWFASDFIIGFFALMLVGIIAGIVWEWREKEPVVDLKMLKDRNFAIATLAMFFLGFVLYASTVLIPQLLQQLLGYTAQLAGMALSPGGAVIMCMMPIVGILVSKVDTRILITFGCLVSSLALFVMAGWDLGLDFRHAVQARMLQGFGLAFLFIPINVAAFAFVPKESDDHAGPARTISHRAADRTRQRIERGLSPGAARYRVEARFRGLDGGACQRAGASDGLRHHRAAGGDAGVSRRFQNAGHRVFRGDSNSAAVEEAKNARRRSAGALRKRVFSR